MYNENRFEGYGTRRRGLAASVCVDFRALCRVAAASASLPMVRATHHTIGKLRRLRLPLPPACQIILTDTAASRTAMTLCLAAGAMLSLIGGCQSHIQDDAMANAYYLSPCKDLRELGRVALVEVNNLSDHPGISRDVTKALFLELQKKQLFGLVRIDQDDAAWQTLQEGLDSGRMMQTMRAIREGRKCDGLLMGTITEYQPYPRLVIGLHLKLLDLTDGHVLWGVEQVWDGMDKGVRRRIHSYSQRELRTGSAAVPEELVPVSSLEFMKFVASEVAQTLDGLKQ